MSQTVPIDRVRIFNRAGLPVAEFTTSVSRSWAIAKEGRAAFTYPTRKSDVVKRDILQFGNYLLVENSVLPSWVGIIDPPREWNGNTVTVNAFTPERMFNYRRGANGERLITGAAGSIFQEMINVINAAERTIIQAGDIWAGGASRQETLTPSPLIRNLRQLQSRSLEEYSFDPLVTNGRLSIRANWLKQLGQPTPLTLYQADGGGNIEDPKAKEDGVIINDVFGYGEGLTWASKPQVTNIIESSADSYGLRQIDKNWSGVTSVSTVQSNNLNYLRSNYYAKWRLGLTALNVGDTFDFVRLGNGVRISLEDMGFGDERIGIQMPARIMGMSYDPSIPNKIKLAITEEV